MRVLLIGSGGREDALAWAIRQSPKLTLLRCAPGNAGMAHRGELVDLGAGDLDGIVEHATQERYDLVVVGPEAPLVAGLADRLAAVGIPAFGCSEAAAMIEGSKVFSKRFMERHGLPSAAFQLFTDYAKAEAYLKSADATYPLVVKADGLAAGKGVILADDAATAIEAAASMLRDGRFGEAGLRVLVEEMLFGREVSIFALSDGKHVLELEAAQDYKRALDGDAGPNTGGMGTYSPSVFLDAETRAEILSTIIRPTIDALAEEERPYRGVLYCGVMLTEDGPKVLEYNARFGDPETQALLPRLDGDWLELLHACATGNLADQELRWKSEAAVCVVMASGGYPGNYKTGIPIEGIQAAEAMGGVSVFHAGTTLGSDGGVVTAGGRVLGVTALGSDIATARSRAYEAVRQISWDGEHHRNDIAADAVSRQNEEAE
jgi:phosphoribosylamine--glycine ligase